jgi:uncharacterized protein with NRDE domain
VCTLALYFGQFDDLPLIVAANRDEAFERPSLPPRIISNTPLIAGGKDLIAGGTWLGWSEHGLVAGVLNRRTAAEGKSTTVRSRGLLCLDVLSASGVAAACAVLRARNGLDYQPFRLLIAHPKEGACIAYNDGAEIRCRELKRGLHVFSNDELHEPPTNKTDMARLLFSKIPENLTADHSPESWVDALHSALGNHHVPEDGADPKGAVCVHTPYHGTVSSTLVFLQRAENRFRSFHAAGPPCRAAHEPSVCIKVR